MPDSVIAEANGIAAPYLVKIGQTLIIPRQRTHTVSAGDTLSEITERYSVPASNIALANGLDAKGTVKLGQKLIIPAVLPERALGETPVQPYFRAPHDGKVILGWKRRPDGGGHAGLDFAVGRGDMVRAAAGGIVISGGEDASRWGKLVVIDHGNGWQSLYGELARTTVAVGDAIKAGERLGIGGRAARPRSPNSTSKSAAAASPSTRHRCCGCRGADGRGKGQRHPAHDAALHPDAPLAQGPGVGRRQPADGGGDRADHGRGDDPLVGPRRPDRPP